MAILKKAKKVVVAPDAPVAPKAINSSAPTDRTHVLRNARITEKATILAGMNVYVFDIATNASKRDVIMAVRDIYKVIPTAVRVVRVVDKIVRSRRTGSLGTKRGGKKAYITLKKGETITI
ncbi:MAG: ribosomal protein [Candidatus Kaiserbacteria bacterium]|nr:ribosomal protein [Candidatus Kaiserbacteria bacterium]